MKQICEENLYYLHLVPGIQRELSLANSYIHLKKSFESLKVQILRVPWKHKNSYHRFSPFRSISQQKLLPYQITEQKTCTHTHTQIKKNKKTTQNTQLKLSRGNVSSYTLSTNCWLSFLSAFCLMLTKDEKAT